MRPDRAALLRGAFDFAQMHELMLATGLGRFGQFDPQLVVG